MEFVKLELPEKHIFKGKEFPVALQLNRNEASHSEVLKYLSEKAKDGYFNKLLEDHGAIVLRNLGNSDIDSLTDYIKVIGWDSGDEFFDQNGTVAQRTEINQYLSTANEGPSSRMLYQHNEFSRFKKFPKKLFFACNEFSAEGGETPIVHGGEYFEDIYGKEPELVKELAQKGLYMQQVWPLTTENKTSWSDKFTFGRNVNKEVDSLEQQKKKAEEIVIDSVSDDYYFDEGDDLVVHQHTQPIRVYKRADGESYPCFFNSIANFHGDKKYALEGHGKTASLQFDKDSTDIPMDFLDKILESSVSKAYNHKWQTGDLAIVDNYQVSHGRLPWNGGRKILVSMWDIKEKQPFEPWVPA